MSFKSNIIIGTIVIGVLLTSYTWYKLTPSSSEGWERATSFFDKRVENTKVYQVPSKGWNFRLYEWECPQNPKLICWLGAGTNKAGGGNYPKAVK